MPFCLRRLAAAGLFLAALLLAARPGLARAGVWTESSPGGGPVFSLAVDPSAPDTVYAAAGTAGVYKSRDGGASWSWSSRGMAGENVHLVVLDPARPEVLYAATAETSFGSHRAEEEVFRSPDGGAHWESVFKLKIYRGERLDVAVARGVVYLMTPRDLFRSADGGAAWTRVFAAGSLDGVEVDPRDPGTAYLATPVGLLKTTDGGASWSQAGPLSGWDYAEGIWFLAVAPAHPDTLYVAAGAGPRLFRSDDGGATWSPGLPLAQEGFRLAVDPHDPSTLYTFGYGVAVSHDGGATFEPIDHGLPANEFYGGPLEILSLAIRPDRPGTLYAGTQSDGVHVTRNARRWEPAADGLSAQWFYWLKASPQAPSTLYAFTPSRLIRSTDGGATWSPFAADLSRADFTIRDLAVDPRDPALLFAATTRGIYRSTDGGAAWTHLGFYQDIFNGMVEVDRDTLVATVGFGIYRTRNGGRTWQEVLNRSLGRPANLAGRTAQWLKLDPAHPETIYGLVVEVYNPEGFKAYLVRSTDAGATWQALEEDFYSIDIAPGRPRTLLAAQSHQVLRSTDGGSRWSVIAEVPGVSFADLAFDRFDPNTVYAGTDGQGVYRSLDGGVTWAPLNAGLARLGRDSVYRVVPHPSIPGRVYALPAEGGIFQGDF
ncbi:MAG TPA: hypothetical protein VHU81_15710 [Thermoanaerobaculia bacterium]|nr:hypothetical protein [Thermoanaerobaculia bacterium]